jgi:hypothetical protein
VRAESRARALDAAEAGLAETLARLEDDPWTGSFEGALGDTPYEVDVVHGTEPAPWRTAQVTCRARAGDQTRGFVAVLEILNDPTRVPPLPMRLASWRPLP